MAEVVRLERTPGVAKAPSEVPLPAGIVATDGARRIVALLDGLKEHGGLGVISAPSGVGKTHTVRAWAAENYAIYCAPDGGAFVNGAKLQMALFDCLSKQNRLATSRPDLRSMMPTLVRGMRKLDWDCPDVLIIDEGQRLDFDGITAASDFAERGVPTVIVGGPELFKTLFADPHTKKGQEWAAVRSRVWHRLAFGMPDEGDAEAVLSAEGVSDARTLKLLCDIATNPGHLREAVGIWRTAFREAGGGSPPHSAVRSAARQWGYNA
jgi:DNA transposition AAA+ family ATPase